MRYPRCSPLQAALDKLRPEWMDVAGMPIPRHFGDPAAETAALGHLALADLSALPKLGLKGPGAAAWLEAQGLPAPGETYAWATLAAGCGLAVRVSADEFFLEDALDCGTVPLLRERLGTGSAACRLVERHDAGLALCGTRVREVMARTCAFDFGPTLDLAVMTRVAGVTCMLLPAQGAGALRLWCDPSYGVYLWDTLLEIVEDLDGRAAGLEALRAAL